MALAAGKHLGPYEILSPLGAGGMGEVYRANDPRLGREVAIKVLPPDRLADETRRRRFIQEARAASQLNHPNIVTIHEIERDGDHDFIVMELVPGRGLDKRIPRGGMSVDQALRLAIPIADALARAHDAGIVHRDLKPANVVVSDAGVPKVLDFGLAKLLASEDVGEQMTATEETGAEPLSATGAISGTPAYMSPEQATGRPVDARSDVFSFGTMLYEMVTGQRPFSGVTRQAVLNAVSAAEPRPAGSIAKNLPAELDKLILRCLRKDPERRFQHVSDVKVLLQDVLEDLAVARPPAQARGSRAGILGGFGLIAVVAALGGWWASTRRSPPPESLVTVTTMSGNESYASFSPDATQVAFGWEGEGSRRDAQATKHIWIKLVAGMEVRQVTSAADDDWAPAWSPDGSRIAFTRIEGRVGRPEARVGTVYLVSALGGSERPLADFPAPVSQLSWSPDGRFIAASRVRRSEETAPEASGIYLLPVDGGEPRPLILPPQPGVARSPAFAPDGRALAYAACEGLITPPCQVFVQELDAALRPRGDPRRLTRQQGPVHGIAWTRDGGSIVYAVSGMQLAGRGMTASLWRAPVDAAAPPQRLTATPPGAYAPATTLARDRLLFVHDRSDLDVYRFSASGSPEPVMASSSVDYGPRISPDGRRIVVESWRAGTTAKEIWLTDIDGSHPVQLTHVADDRESPALGTGAPYWSPDGTAVVHIREEPTKGPGATNLWVVGADGGPDRRLTDQPLRLGPPAWSRDGHIYFRHPRPGGTDIFRIPAAGGTPERVTHHGGLMAEASWDGKRLLYSEREATGPLFLLDLASGAERKLEECAWSRALASSRDSFFFVGCSTDAEQPLYRFDIATGRRTRLGFLTNVTLGLTASPDGQTILYARENLGGADLMMIENFR